MRLRLELVIGIPALLIILLVAAHFIYGAQYPVTCTTALSRSSVLAADRVRYEIAVTSKSDIDAEIPDAMPLLSGFTVTDSGSSREAFLGRVRSTAWYLMTQYTPGTYTIGPVTVTYRLPDGQTKRLEGRAVTLTVRSARYTAAQPAPQAAIADSLAEIRSNESLAAAKRKAKTPVVIKIVDMRGPIELLTITDIVLVGTELALAAFIASWAIPLVRRRVEDALRITPYESACKELASIKSAAAKKAIPAGEYCSGISSALKRYVKDAFSTGSAELTTAEFLAQIDTGLPEAAPLRGKVVEALSFCDLVRFSGYVPSHEALDGSLETVREIIAALHMQEVRRRSKGTS